MSTDPAAAINTPDFWENIYRSDDARWDMGTPTPAFIDLFERLRFPCGSMLVPGCGRGYDAIYFAQQGFTVTAVDFAETAARGTAINAARAGVELDVVQDDLFALDKYFPARFDYVLEYTCFCAIDVSRREEYVRTMRAILKPGGMFIGLFFPMDDRPGGPPFAVREEEIIKLFSPHFHLQSSEFPARSVTPRKGKEKMMIWILD